MSLCCPVPRLLGRGPEDSVCRLLGVQRGQRPDREDAAPVLHQRRVRGRRGRGDLPHGEPRGRLCECGPVQGGRGLGSSAVPSLVLGSSVVSSGPPSLVLPPLQESGAPGSLLRGPRSTDSKAQAESSAASLRRRGNPGPPCAPLQGGMAKPVPSFGSVIPAASCFFLIMLPFMLTFYPKILGIL